MHVSVQYFQAYDKDFTMGEITRELISQAANNFLSFKGEAYLKSLNNFLLKSEYNLDDFLLDLYVRSKISNEDELAFLNLFEELSPNYDLKVSTTKINQKVVVNYFMEERNDAK